MFFNALISIVILVLLLFTSAQAEQLIENNRFTVQPEKCVALRQGKVCVAEVKFNWHTERLGNYCLLEKIEQRVIQCWQNSKSGSYQFAFSSQQSLLFLLVEESTNKVLLESKVEVSWVYKTKQKKRRWRLF